MSALKNILSKKTDSQLMFYINNIDKHTDEAIELALLELKSRGVILEGRIEEKITEELSLRAQKKEFVLDESYQPPLYTEVTIYVFGILFSVIFGGCLIAYNRRKIGMESFPVVIAAIICELILKVTANYFDLGLAYNFIANGVGIVFIFALFWKQRIPAHMKYPAKKIWIPLMIALGLFVVGIIFYLQILSVK